MKYRWLLFDADDTLFDYPAAEAQALRLTFEQSGAAYLPEYLGIYKTYNSQVWREYESGGICTTDLRTKRFRLLFEKIGLRLDPQAFSPIYLRNLSLGSNLLEGAKEVLTVLRTRYSLALVTNGLAEVQRPRLERSAIRDCFEHVFISEEIGAAKPEKAFFDAVFQAIGNPPENEVMIVGDSLAADMQGGLNYGMATCWYNPRPIATPLPVTYQIAELRELLNFL